MFRLSDILRVVFHTVMIMIFGYIILGMAVGFMPPVTYVWYHMIFLGLIFGVYKSTECLEELYEKKYWTVLDEDEH